MQSPFTSLLLGVAFAFLLTSRGDGQDRSRPDPRHSDSTALEKRIAELEGKVSGLGKEVEDFRRELRVQTAVAVVPLRNIDAEEAVAVIREVYLDHPGIEVAVLAQTKTVIVQADKKTKEEIVDLLQKLDVPIAGMKAEEQRLFKLKKPTGGRPTASRLIFSEDVERAMLMDSVER